MSDINRRPSLLLVPTPTALSSIMPLFGRGVAAFIPADQVPAWVQGNQVSMYLGVVLATLVVYDAGESSF